MYGFNVPEDDGSGSTDCRQVLSGKICRSDGPKSCLTGMDAGLFLAFPYHKRLFLSNNFSWNFSCKPVKQYDSVYAVFLFMNVFFRTGHQNLSVSPAPAPLPVTGKGPDKGAPEHWLGYKRAVLPTRSPSHSQAIQRIGLSQTLSCRPIPCLWTLCKAFFL